MMVTAKEWINKKKTIKRLKKDVKKLMKTEKEFGIDNSKLIDFYCRKIVFLEGL